MSESAATEDYIATENRIVEAANGTSFVFRELGSGEVPLVLLQHFRGNLDNWDPRLIDALAENRRVVTFDNTGVGGSTGTTPHTIAEMATDAIAFVEALEFDEIDLFGFSIGSFVAQEMALIRPNLLRRIVLASSAPRGAAGMHGWAPHVIGQVGGREPSPEGYLNVFYAPSATSREAGGQSAQRIFGARTEDRDAETTWQTRQAQYDAVCSWGVPDHGLLQRVSAIHHPTFIANGDSDPMVLPHFSYLLAGLIPQADVKIYPDSAHGFLFQHAAEFAADVEAFLADESGRRE
ncbi:MAG: alpha/beta fold hydrolase [Solirubrobacterales bacterium]